jgi:hypothetical protein
MPRRLKRRPEAAEIVPGGNAREPGGAIPVHHYIKSTIALRYPPLVFCETLATGGRKEVQTLVITPAQGKSLCRREFEWVTH